MGVLFILVLAGFNVLAVLIVAGRNPPLAAGRNRRTGKWNVRRHKDNLFSTAFGYLWAGGLFFIDFMIIRAMLRG